MGKIIIMGPGRCGTTFLAQLLRALGEDTGGHDDIFRERQADIKKNENFEWPRVLKGTGTLCAGLNRWVKEQDWEVDFVFLCTRELESNIQSMMKMKRHRRAYKGLIDEEFEVRIREEVLRGHRQAKEQASIYSYCEVRFPDSARDRDYCYSCVVQGLSYISEKEFKIAWNKVRRPDLIRYGPN